MDVNSCLYECAVMHHRFAPKVHHFQHDIFMFYLDLDELDLLARKIFSFSHNRDNLYSFRDADHEPAGKIRSRSASDGVSARETASTPGRPPA